MVGVSDRDPKEQIPCFSLLDGKAECDGERHLPLMGGPVETLSRRVEVESGPDNYLGPVCYGNISKSRKETCHESYSSA